MSVVIKCFKTVEPNEPVPPVITKVLFLNASLILFMVIDPPSLILSVIVFLIATENIASVCYFKFLFLSRGHFLRYTEMNHVSSWLFEKSSLL